MITFKAKTPNGEIINSALSPFSFPAGEAHLKREDRRELEPTEIAIITSSADSLHDDLFQLAAWSQYLDFQAGVRRVLIIPYVPGARADRGLPTGTEVYGSFISNLLLDQVIVFDPHSTVIVRALEYQGNNCVTVTTSAQFFHENRIGASIGLDRYAGIIAPDNGAVRRASQVAEIATPEGLPVYTATKTRNPDTGKLSGFRIEGLPETGKLLVVDDICDGGGTFMGLAQASGLPKERLDLFVSHGVFSGNAAQLENAFDTVYTTNSYKSKNVELDYTVLPVIPFLLSKAN